LPAAALTNMFELVLSAERRWRRPNLIYLPLGVLPAHLQDLRSTPCTSPRIRRAIRESDGGELLWDLLGLAPLVLLFGYVLTTIIR